MGDRSLAARAGCVFGHRSRPCSALRNIAKALASDSVAHVNAAVQTAHPGDCIRCQKRTPLSPLTSFSNSNPLTPSAYSATLGTRFARLGSLQIASPACAAVTRLCAKKTGIKIAIIPLLFEAHWEKNFDIICCVVSSREKQIERMMTTRGMTRAEAEARLAAQMPVEDKAKRSHYVIHNDGTAEELKVQAAAFLKFVMQKQMQPKLPND